MKFMLSFLICLSFGIQTILSQQTTKQAEEILQEWVDTLLTYQISHSNPSLDGGLLCPACARIHGRCGDAVLPLMYMAQKTSNPKYITAAQRLMKWMENVHTYDGAWMNDVNVSDWNGTTVFSAIALYEALHEHGHLLNDSTYQAWKSQLLPAGEFIYQNDFIYSRRRENMRNMNVNYSASATYALYAIGKMFNHQDFIDRAQLIATDLRAFFTENDYFLFGEGPEIKNKTKNGCLPVDLLYNIEESLPNMIYYAQMSGDTALMNLIEKSINTHLHFMLPDGAWDNSWGTRSFKWMYWGGRTSDGFMGGYAALAKKHPEYTEAIHRNLMLLKQSTHKGLLSGIHYNVSGMETCIHHTFGHSKALASYLNQPQTTTPAAKLPSDTAFGMKYFKDIHTWLIGEGDWRATITGYDAEYKVKGTHPMGGALSLLWHKSTGPIFAATMNQYTLIEAPNMQADLQEYRMAGTPRIEIVKDDIMYSNLDDLDAQISYTNQQQAHCFDIKAHLVDSKQQHFSATNDNIELQYILDAKELTIRGKVPGSVLAENVRLLLPVISSPTEMYIKEEKTIRIEKESGSITITGNTPILIDPTNDGRIFNPIPGFSFIPIVVLPNEEGIVEAKIQIQ